MQKPDENSNGVLLVNLKNYGAQIKKLQIKYRALSESAQQRAILGDLLTQYIETRPKGNLLSFLSSPEDIFFVQKSQKKFHQYSIEDLLKEIDSFCENQPSCELRSLLIAFIIYMPINMLLKCFNLKSWLKSKSDEYRALRTGRSSGRKLILDPESYKKKETVLPVIKEMLSNDSYPTNPSIYVSIAHEKELLNFLLLTKVRDTKISALLFENRRTTEEYLFEQFKVHVDDAKKLRIINIIVNLQPKTNLSIDPKAMLDFLLGLYKSDDCLANEEIYHSTLKLFIRTEKTIFDSFLVDKRLPKFIETTINLITEPQKNFPEELFMFLAKVYEADKELLDLTDLEALCVDRLIALMQPAYSQFNMHYPSELATYFVKAFKRKLTVSIDCLVSIVYIPREPENFSIPSFREFLHNVQFEKEIDLTSIIEMLRKILVQFEIGKDTYYNKFYAEMFFITAERFNFGFVDIIGGLEKEIQNNPSCEALLHELLNNKSGEYHKIFIRTAQNLRYPRVTKLESGEKAEFYTKLEEKELRLLIGLQENPPEVRACVALFATLPTLKQLQFRNNCWGPNTWKVVKYFCYNLEPLTDLNIPIQKSVVVAAARMQTLANRLDYIIFPLETWLEKHKTDNTVTQKIVLEILEKVYSLPVLEQSQAEALAKQQLQIEQEATDSKFYKGLK